MQKKIFSVPNSGQKQFVKFMISKYIETGIREHGSKRGFEPHTSARLWGVIASLCLLGYYS